MLADLEQKVVAWEDLKVAEEPKKKEPVIEAKRVAVSVALPDNPIITEDMIRSIQKEASRRLETYVREAIHNSLVGDDRRAQIEKLNAQIRLAVERSVSQMGQWRPRRFLGRDYPGYHPSRQEFIEIPGWIARALFPEYPVEIEVSGIVVPEETLANMYREVANFYGLPAGYDMPLHPMMSYYSRMPAERVMGSAWCTPSRDSRMTARGL